MAANSESNDEASCREVTFDGANDAERCRCKGATLKAYHGMLQHGAAEGEAVQAAFKIYCYHHPCDTAENAHLTVERWIYAERAH